ncbi:UNVERIFIED_CONTAM: P2X purinoceptor 3 [Gekko kuhli]
MLPEVPQAMAFVGGGPGWTGQRHPVSLGPPTRAAAPTEAVRAAVIVLWGAERPAVPCCCRQMGPQCFGWRGNLLPNLTTEDIRNCRFDPEEQPFCPILRLGDIVKLAKQDFAKLATTGGIIGIKIGWVCDLDHSWDRCVPKYSFTRLDSVSEKNSVSTGYNFRYAKYYKHENGTEYRTLMKAYGIRFDVLVYGNAGKFNIIPTLINTVAAFTSVGVGTVLCDIILLNFLKGADQYKAKKFEEVTDTVLHPGSSSNPVYRSSQTLGGRSEEKQSTDSGAYSIGL